VTTAHLRTVHAPVLQGLEAETESYEIRVKGRLGRTTLSAFEEFESSVMPIETVFYGDLPDQAALHGVLDRLQSFGLELVEVRRLPSTLQPANGRPSQAT
jgi:hypothetical protein